jgi:HEAT repeat protein
MADAPAPDHGKGKGNSWVAVIAVAVIAAAIGVYLYRSPQEDGARTVIVRIARAFGRLVGYQDRARKPIEVIIREIEHGDALTRTQTISLLHVDLTGPAEFARVFPYLVRATKDESEMVRSTMLAVFGRLILRFGRDGSGTDGRKFEESLADLLNESSPKLRASAAKFLRALAAARQLYAPPPQLVACLDDESEEVRAAAAESLVEYGQGPELFLPIALRRLPTESPIAYNEFKRILWNLRFRPTVLPILIEGLSSDNMLVCVSAATVINHMGLAAKPARPAVMALLRKELETPHPKFDLRLMDWGDGSAVPTSGVSLVIVGSDRNGVLHFRIFGPAGRRVTDTDETKLTAQVGAISALKKQLQTLSPPHALSLAEKTQVITAVTSIAGQTGLNDEKWHSVDIIEQTSEALMQISPDGDSLPGTLEILCEVLKRPSEMGQLGAAWSLGLLGRSARPAVPLLISAFETAPKDSHDLRGRIAMALAQISQGTPDEDRVSASLAKAWNTAPPILKNAIAQALRTLGPKSERLVPELREMPRRDLWPKIQRGYSPRSFLGEAKGIRNE